MSKNGSGHRAATAVPLTDQRVEQLEQRCAALEYTYGELVLRVAEIFRTMRRACEAARIEMPDERPNLTVVR